MTLTVRNKVGRKAWLQGYAKSTQYTYSAGYDAFLKFMNQTEEGEWTDQRLIEERKEDVKNRSFAFEQKAVEFYEWLKTYDENFSDHTRQTYLLSVRSFFAFHRLDLQFNRPQKAKITKRARPKRNYYDFTLNDIRAMLEVSKPKERYILAVGKDLGLRAVDFANLKQGRFLHLDQEPPIPLGEIYTKKEGVSAKPFLGYDGVKAVKQWLTVLESKDRLDPEAKMLEIDKKELSEILKRLAKRANLNLGNQQIRFHQLRVFLITRLSKVLESNRWKQIVGKQVPESSYVKPFELREDHRKVLPLITVNSRALPKSEELEKVNKKIIDLESENITLKQIIIELGKNLEEVKQNARVQEEKINKLMHAVARQKAKRIFSEKE